MGKPSDQLRRPQDLGFSTTVVVLGSLPVALVGEQPTVAALAEGSGYEPLSGRPTDFLAGLVGLDGDELRTLVGRMNLMESPGTWVARRAAEKAEYLRRELLPLMPWNTLVLLGRQVQDAFGIDRHNVPVGSIELNEGLMASWIPHPSGLNRWWNDPANRELAAAELRRVLRDA